MWLFERPIAHRGLHNETLTENSMGAFRNALEHGYNIEIDVHLLKSGEVVIFHDGSLNRVCGKDVKITDLTLDDIKGDEYLLPSGEHIPLLTELLDLIGDGKTGILLEIKFAGFSFALEKALYELIKGKESFIALQSFSPWTMKWFRENAPEFYNGILSTGALLPLTRLMHKKIKPDFIAYDVKFVNGKGVQKLVNDNNYKLLCWTVRTEANIEAAKKAGANNIIFEKLDLDAVGFKLTDLKA
ncbi:MAG TPA: glycerophosphodiester phosphodiesterase family protein [Clostridia bacterium]|nr:glycerophosphodiester phosphodiesterase family protein [Clostridia bacterium]